MLEQNKIDFQQEQNQLLKTVLDLRYFQPWKEENNQYSLRNDANLEIFITPSCNQHCEYCYLVKYDGLYPKEINNKDTILNNLKILYDYIIEQKYHIPKIEFFTGEIWHTNFGLEILEITYQYLQKGLNVDWFMIASNCSFVADDIQLQRIQSYINKFKEIGNQLIFSISYEGRPLEEESRPSNTNLVKDDEYCEKLFAFAKHNNYYFHPMVSANNVYKWIENYNWYKEQLAKYGMNVFERVMMLEVRNANWTEKACDDYCNFLNYIIEDYIETCCNGDIKKFAKHLMSVRLSNQEEEQNLIKGYVPFCVSETDSFIGCTCATDLTVRLGDLAICPCHRTSYNTYLYGKFVVENNKIVDIEANNPQMAIKIIMSNFNLASFGCDKCVYNFCCLKGCYGSQLETMGDPFIPIPNICHFFDRKMSFLFKKYEELGIIDYYKTFTPYERDYERVKRFLDTYKRWKKKNEKMEA